MIFPLWASIGSGLGIYVILVSVSYAAGVTRKEWKRQKREFLAQESMRYQQQQQQKSGVKKVVIDFHDQKRRQHRPPAMVVCHQPPVSRKQMTDDERSWSSSSSSSSYAQSSSSASSSVEVENEEVPSETTLSISPPSPQTEVEEAEETVFIPVKSRKPGSVFSV